MAGGCKAARTAAVRGRLPVTETTMNHVLSTHLFANHRLNTVWLDKISDHGIPAVEIFCARQHVDWQDASQIRQLAAWFRDSELKLHSLHAPLYTDEVSGRSGPQSILKITEPLKAKRNAIVDEIKRAIEIADNIPCRYVIQHIGVPGEEYDERKVEAAFTALDEISSFAGQRGVEVLLENIPNAFSTSDRLNLFNEQTHLKLNYCFDIGHANMTEGVETAFRGMGDRIRSTHIHDNNGKEDNHLFPLASEGGTIDWAKAMDLLRSRADQYPLLLELKGVPARNPLPVVRDIFEKLESLEPPHER
jgi:sugar phosphate isomerase/epimerase